MKRYSIIMIMLVFSVSTSLSHAGFVPQVKEGTVTVARLLIAGSIENTEPVGIVNAFSSSTEKVYCFLEARDIQEDTTVRFVWFHENSELANIPLQLVQGQRWRTWSSKRLGGRSGTWKVELQDGGGNILGAVEFMVE